MQRTAGATAVAKDAMKDWTGITQLNEYLLTSRKLGVDFYF